MVYFTAMRSMLVRLLAIMGEPDCSVENLADLVGEMANTISGNARKDFGEDFMIFKMALRYLTLRMTP